MIVTFVHFGCVEQVGLRANGLFQTNNLVQPFIVAICIHQGLILFQLGSFAQAGFTKNALDGFDCLHGIASHQEHSDTELFGLLNHQWTGAQVSGQDQAGGGSLQRGQLNVGAITSGDDSFIRVFPETAERSIGGHGAYGKIFDQSLWTGMAGEHLSLQDID